MGIKLSFILTIPTEKITTGILNIITIILPREKFLLFNKFIEDDIDPINDRINDPKRKLNNKNFI